MVSIELVRDRMTKERHAGRTVFLSQERA